MHKNSTYNSALIGQPVKRVKVILAKSSSPTGTVSVVVRKASDDSIAHTFGTISASTLTTSDQTFTLEPASAYTIAVNDRILVEWGGTGSRSYQVWIKNQQSIHLVALMVRIPNGHSMQQATVTRVAMI